MSTLQINYSNTIFYLKLFLFFLGLLAIILIFWSAKKIEPSTEIPFAKDVDFTSLNDGLIEPLYSSITKSGDELQIQAKQIVATERKDTALIKSASLKIFSENRPGIFLSSEKALLNKDKKNLIFIDNVVLETEDKIEITAPKIYVSLDITLIRANGPISGIFPNNSIKAGQLDIFKENNSSDLVISFTKGVEMVYNSLQ
jgi:LPS export ABC transporter protein LptC